MSQRLVHTIPPVFDAECRVLILGSFPSVASREQGFYYANSQNRFWRVIAAVYGFPVPESVDEKKRLLLLNHTALWDAAQSCETVGSQDARIRDVVANNLSVITDAAPIRRVFTNGAKAHELFTKYCGCSLPETALPSTSPANAACSLANLIERWRVITE